MKHRRGYSLIEMVLVIGSLTVVMALCVATLHALMKLDRAARARINESATLDRLAHQFRQDVRAATRGQHAGNEDSRLDLALPHDHKITYEWSSGRLVRVDQAPGRAEQHEVYRLPNRGAARFHVRDEGDQVWVTFSLAGKADVARLVPDRAFRVEALLGKDRRFASISGGPSR